MSFARATDRICLIAEAVTPTVHRDTKFRRLDDKSTAETVSPTGVTRRFQLVAERVRRGPAVCGTGPKQLVQVFVLRVPYARTDKLATDSTIQLDGQLLRAALEDVGNYAGDLQNIEALDFSVVRLSDRLLGEWTLEVTYTGDA